MMGVNVPLVQLLAIVMLVLLSGLPAAAREQYPGQYDNVDPVIREDLPDRCGDVPVLARQQLRAPVHDCHATTESAEHPGSTDSRK